MPRYFFDITDHGFHRDEEGSECADFDAARDLAIQTLPEVARLVTQSDQNHQIFAVSIRDEAGSVLYTARFVFEAFEFNRAAK